MVDMDLQCMSWQPYMFGQIMSKRRTATLENCKQILGCSLQVFSPGGLCLFPWLIYKVLHLSPCSNLVLWGAICYTIFSHWSSHLDIEPTLSLVTLTPCLPVTPLHFTEYLIDLCLAIRQVSSLWSSLEILNLDFSILSHLANWQPMTMSLLANWQTATVKIYSVF